MYNLKVDFIQEKIQYSFLKHGKEINILGYLDLRGEHLDTQEIVIRDWKVTKRKKNIKQIQSDQDLIYTWVIWKQTGKIPVFEYFYFIVSEKTGNIQHQKFIINHTQENLQEFEKYIYDTIRGINQTVFYRNESSWLCSSNYCEYYNNCQSYKNNIKIQEG